VRELRLKRKFSQEAFADHCGVHRTFMGTIERGETNLSLLNLARVSSALGITLSQLLSGVEKKAETLASVPAGTPMASPKRSPIAVGKSPVNVEESRSVTMFGGVTDWYEYAWYTSRRHARETAPGFYSLQLPQVREALLAAFRR